MGNDLLLICKETFEAHLPLICKETSEAQLYSGPTYHAYMWWKDYSSMVSWLLYHGKVNPFLCMRSFKAPLYYGNVTTF